ncbi:MAG TPA: hypothetical protein PKN13_15495, partial [Accumulibacter sp.]|nr:hypothetical protein [Accumulibacter sp.]HNM76706.1 hypothetical protein [Accumulibacter sp.]
MRRRTRYRSVQMYLGMWLEFSCDSRQGVSGAEADASGAAAFSARRAPERKSLDKIQAPAANDQTQAEALRATLIAARSVGAA